MIFGGLSEQELSKISKLLEQEQINFTINPDESMVQANKASMQHNLRHLNSPNISTHILAIEIADTDFNQMSTSLKGALLDFGITNEVPEEFTESNDPDPTQIHQELLKGNKKVIGFNFLHQVILTIVIVILVYLYNKSTF